MLQILAVTCTWINQTSLPTPAGVGTVTLVGTSNGITVNTISGANITTTGILGLDGWEIVNGSKIFRPQAQSGSATQGKMGDPLHIIAEINVNNVVLFNSALTFAHTISSGATAAYTWTTPNSNPSAIALVNCTASGQLGYVTPPSDSTQVLTSQGPGNAPLWVEQCSFAGLNNEVLLSPFSLNVFGVVVNTGTMSNCLVTVNPGPNVGSAANKVLITNASGDITWALQSSIIPVSGVTSVGTSNGLTVGGVAGGTITSTGVLGLDGWEIVNGSKIFRPFVQSGNTTQGKLGDPSHIIAEINVNNIILFNNANTFSHTISSGATTTYTWTTPSGNPSLSTSLVNCTTTGQLGYVTPPTDSTQFLSSQGVGNSPMWIEQCMIAGLNNTVTSVPFATGTYGVVINNGSATNCLNTLNPGATIGAAANQILVTNGSGNVVWEAQSALPFVTSVGTSNGLTVGGVVNGTITSSGVLGLNGWEIVVSGSNYVFRPKATLTGNIGDSTHVVNQIYDTTLSMVGSNNNIVNITASNTTTNYNITLPPQINPSFDNNAVMSITNTGVASFLTKLQPDNVTMPYNFLTETPATSPFTITVLNSVYAINLTTFGSSGTFNVKIPDATAANSGYSICIYKSSNDNVNLVISTTSNQPINAATSYTLVTQGLAVLLVAQNASNWAILGTSVPSFYVPLPISQYFYALYAPTASTRITTVTDVVIGQQIFYTSVVFNNLPGAVYTSGTGIFTFSVAGTYTISLNQSFAYYLDENVNTWMKFVLIQGTTLIGTEIASSPTIFFNNESTPDNNNNGGHDLILFNPAFVQMDTVVSIVAGQSYTIWFKMVTDEPDNDSLVELAPVGLAPSTTYSNAYAGSLKINRIG